MPHTPRVIQVTSHGQTGGITAHSVEGSVSVQAATPKEKPRSSTLQKWGFVVALLGLAVAVLVAYFKVWKGVP